MDLKPTRPNYMPIRKSLSFKDMHRMKVTEWKKAFHTNGNVRKAWVVICITDKIDFKLKAVTRDREGHYIMTKWSIHQEDINIVSIYAPKLEHLNI